VSVNKGQLDGGSNLRLIDRCAPADLARDARIREAYLGQQ